ncbi:hypothetical protein [Mycobacterium sp. ST-F2]|uniref:hypothetical protein n=1 Tax=Mycobacterium sp. ST-F2 TaxID=1490484 RepID=UPI00115208F7|nr:hypothetical protein [Mycobacterium sp. ST-F2]
MTRETNATKVFRTDSAEGYPVGESTPVLRDEDRRQMSNWRGIGHDGVMVLRDSQFAAKHLLGC